MTEFAEPQSMDEVVYFTNRSVGEGKIRAWARKKECPACHKAKMGKPVEKGKVLIRAKEYVCPLCGHTEEKKEHEHGLEMEIIYVCPYCRHSGTAKCDYRRRTWQGVQAYVFSCGSCGKAIGISKKMK